MNAVKGSPSKHGLCAYFPFGEYFIKKREVIRADELSVDVANIKPDSPAASQLAHQQRLQSELPDPCDFGAEYSCTYGFKGGASPRPKAQRIDPQAYKIAQEITVATLVDKERQLVLEPNPNDRWQLSVENPSKNKPDISVSSKRRAKKSLIETDIEPELADERALIIQETAKAEQME